MLQIHDVMSSTVFHSSSHVFIRQSLSRWKDVIPHRYRIIFLNAYNNILEHVCFQRWYLICSVWNIFQRYRLSWFFMFSEMFFKFNTMFMYFGHKFDNRYPPHFQKNDIEIFSHESFFLMHHVNSCDIDTSHVWYNRIHFLHYMRNYQRPFGFVS